MSDRRDAVVKALKKAGNPSPTEDDIDTAANQLDYMCDPVSGQLNGGLDLDTAADDAVVKAKECCRKLNEKRVARKAEQDRVKADKELGKPK